MKKGLDELSTFQKFFGVKDHEGKSIPEGELKGIYKSIISIGWPSTVEGALFSIISSIDTMMVGTLGAAAIAAVGLTSQPRMLLMMLAQALCVGTTALCARRMGANDQKAANACLHQSLALVTCFGVIITLLGYFGAEWLMKLGGANEDTLEMSTAYFKIISLSFLPSCWTMCICAAMRAIGKTRITMTTNVAANLVNVVFNFLLIGGNFGFPALGVRGAAIATALGSCVGCAMAIGSVLHKNSYYHFALPRFDRITLSGLVTVGSNSMIESLCLRLGFLMLARLIAGTGTNAFAAYQIVSQVTTLAFTLGDGVASAGTARVGQSLGAKRKDLAYASANAACKIGLFVSVGLMVLIFVMRRQFALLFTSDETIITGVTLSLYVVMLAMFPQNGRVIRAGALRGAGDVKFVAICALWSVTLLRPILTYLFCYPLDQLLPGLHIATMGPWIAFLIDAVVRDRLMARRIRQAKWLDIKLS